MIDDAWKNEEVFKNFQRAMKRKKLHTTNDEIIFELFKKWLINGKL